MEITNISEAKATLSSLIRQVCEDGEPILIGKAGKPIAVLSAFKAETMPRELGGSWEGKVHIAEDVDTIDNDLVNSFYQSSIFPPE